MKWIFGLILAGFLITGCDNELVVTDKWKDIPVVWGFVSKSDTAIYIRVEKAFLDPSTSALVIAQIPDSLYYDNAVVKLRRIANNQEYVLQKVDGTSEGYPRESGVFANMPNYLYKIKENQVSLMLGEKYQFILDRGDQTDKVTAETFILPKPVIRIPSLGASLNFKTNSSFTFMWNEMEDAGLFDIQMRFNYLEKSPATANIYMAKSVKWTVARSLLDNDFKMDGVEFYNAVAANIDVDPDASRIFQSIDILLWCGGTELQQYIQVALANDGITSTQDFPEYTNLSEGKGIFTSRNFSDNIGYGLTTQSQDSLKNGSITGDLNFE